MYLEKAYLKLSNRMFFITKTSRNFYIFSEIVMTVHDPVLGQFDDADEDILQSEMRTKVIISDESPVSDGGYEEDESDGVYSDDDYFDEDHKKEGDNPNQQMAKTKLSEL